MLDPVGPVSDRLLPAPPTPNRASLRLAEPPPTARAYFRSLKTMSIARLAASKSALPERSPVTATM